MKFAEFAVFALVVFFFIAVFSAFTHRPPEDYANAIIPEEVIVEAGSLLKLPEKEGESGDLLNGKKKLEENDLALKTQNPVQFCRKKDAEGVFINPWFCRYHLWPK